MGILSGTRVIELADWVAGPFCASILSDFGAEVIRIDLPGQVVNTRRLHGMEPVDDERSPFFATFAHDKKSITLDVRTERGRSLFLQLVERSDVLITGFRPGAMAGWNLDAAVLEAANPGLITLNISGYGQTGPWREKPGLDRVAQAFSSATYITGHADGPPVKSGVGFVDYSTGLWGAIGILLALIERRASGLGQSIDQSLYESALPLLCEVPLKYHRYHEIAGRLGNRVKGVSPGDAFLTADERWVQISASGDTQFERLAVAIGQPGLLTDPRFTDMPLRDEHNAELIAVIAQWVAAHTAQEAEDLLERHGVAAGRIQNIEELMAHPQVVAREDFITINDDVFGELLLANVLPRLARTPGRIERPGPRLGEHTGEILGGLLDVPDEELQALRQSGVV
jgi:crotonobetainyl-CoA:carnitine CoA-transferase CaiB-like acyl-CoA transferase